MTGAELRERPYRPRAIAVLNRVGARLAGLGIAAGRMREDELIRAARTRTGLHDFGDEGFREALSVLVDSIEREARLHAVGRLVTKTRLLSALCTRLRVHEYVRRHPEVATLALAPPIVIAGLQRTGTTMLHRLLASDPSLRPVLAWEGMSPLRGRGAVFGIEPGRLKGKMGERALAYMAPAFFAIHPAEADAPEEDVLLLDYAFMSTTPEATLHVPSQARWLEEQDHTPAYEYFALLLRVLAHQHGGAGTRFVLKTPHHLEYLDVLRKVFPGVQVIQTHRDPVRTLASFCSMVWHGRGIFSDQVDAAEVGAHWSRKVGRLLDRSMQVRASVADQGFADVFYYDLVADPGAAVRALYGQLGLSLTPQVESRMQQTREKNPQHKYGSHRYRLEDFGLTAAGVEPLFAAYRKRFAVPHE
ncbi:MAG TPA: sulfotransferase [Candidatus Binatia bacterium]|nr:sulfotransferase [Candidatus Binatia bacterium]